MFRITRVFGNNTVHLYKLEGKLRDEDYEIWNQELNSIRNGDGQEIILDLSQVWYLGGAATLKLIAESNRWYLLNCSMDLRNRMTVSGRASRILG